MPSEKPAKPFPPILFNVGSIRIKPLPLEGTNADPEQGPRTVGNSKYSEEYVSPIESLVTGSLGSLIADSRIDDASQRTWIGTDAFAVHLTEDYPYLLIADGGSKSSKPEHIPQITNDPNIKAAILKFKSDVASTFEDNASGRARVAQLAQGLIRSINSICDEPGRYTFQALHGLREIASQFTISLAIPFVTPTGRTKVVSFGIGGNEIYQLSLEGAVKPLRKAKHETANVLMPTAIDLTSPDYQKRMDEYSKAVRELEVSIEDFQDDDLLFAATDGVDKILLEYNQARGEESKAEGLFKSPTIEELIHLPPKELSELLKKMYDATLQMASDNYNKHKAVPSAEGKNFYFGDTYAFGKMRLTKNPWKLVATPEVLLDIIKDEEYWKTKTIWKKSVPTGIGQMQHTLNTPEHSLREAVHNGIGRLTLLSLTANARHYNYWTYWVSSRQHETQYLYNLVSKPKESYADNEEFQYLYTDWVKHNGPERAAKRKHETAPKVEGPAAAAALSPR